MFTMDLKARLTSKTWWVATLTNIILIVGYFGLDLTQYIGKDWQGLIILIFGLLTQLGITADTSTSGISDKVVSDATVQAINADSQTKEEVKAEATTTAINNTVSQNSASAKIEVANPNNIQLIGQEVNATSASTPN